eukprot:gene9319-1407_t
MNQHNEEQLMLPQFYLNLFKDFNKYPQQDAKKIVFLHDKSINFKNFITFDNTLCCVLKLFPQNIVFRKAEIVHHALKNEFLITFFFDKTLLYNQLIYEKVSLSFQNEEFNNNTCEIIGKIVFLNEYEMNVQINFNTMIEIEKKFDIQKQYRSVDSLNRIFDWFSIKSSKYPSFLFNYSNIQQSKNFNFTVKNYKATVVNQKLELKSVSFEFEKNSIKDDWNPLYMNFNLFFDDDFFIQTSRGNEISLSHHSILVIGISKNSTFLNSYKTFDTIPTELFYNNSLPNITYVTIIDEHLNLMKTTIGYIKNTTLTQNICFYGDDKRICFDFFNHPTNFRVLFQCGQLDKGWFDPNPNEGREYFNFLIKEYNIPYGLDEKEEIKFNNAFIDSCSLVLSIFIEEIEAFIKIPFLSNEESGIHFDSKRYCIGFLKRGLIENGAKLIDLQFQFK